MTNDKATTKKDCKNALLETLKYLRVALDLDGNMDLVRFVDKAIAQAEGK